MKSAIFFSNIEKSVGAEEAARVLANAGFRLLNATVSSDEELREKTALFGRYGFSVYQTHMPINRVVALDDERIRKINFDALSRTAEFGAKYMVVHGDVLPEAKAQLSFEDSLAYNYEYYAPLVERAEKLGVKIAFENTFQDVSHTPHFCARAEELVALVDRFHSDSACICWDTGHGAMQYKQCQSDGIAHAGKLIECTHVHDTYMWMEDLHLPPFFGIIDWGKCIAALKEKTRVEVLCLELHPAVKSLPASVVGTYAELLYKICTALHELA